MDTKQLEEISAEIQHDINEEKIKALTQVLAELKNEDLQFVEMRFFESRPFKEMAEILGITENNTKVKTYRILEKLKKLVYDKLAR